MHWPTAARHALEAIRPVARNKNVFPKSRERQRDGRQAGAPATRPARHGSYRLRCRLSPASPASCWPCGPSLGSLRRGGRLFRFGATPVRPALPVSGDWRSKHAGVVRAHATQSRGRRRRARQARAVERRTEGGRSTQSTQSTDDRRSTCRSTVACGHTAGNGSTAAAVRPDHRHRHRQHRRLSCRRRKATGSPPAPAKGARRRRRSGQLQAERRRAAS
jgi:hypothetical protein